MTVLTCSAKIAAIVACFFAIDPRLSYAAGCTAATLKGTWGKTLLSAGIGGGSSETAAGVGIMTFDGTSKISGTQINANLEGGNAMYTFSGTYTVSANCTVVISTSYSGTLSGTENLTGVIVDGGTKINAVVVAGSSSINSHNFLFEVVK